MLNNFWQNFGFLKQPNLKIWKTEGLQYLKIEIREFAFWGTHSTPKNEIAQMPQNRKNPKKR